jgi:hypothetical protein
VRFQKPELADVKTWVLLSSVVLAVLAALAPLFPAARAAAAVLAAYVSPPLAAALATPALVSSVIRALGRPGVHSEANQCLSRDVISLLAIAVALLLLEEHLA